MQGGSSPHACRAGWDKAGKEASSNIGRYQSYQADYGESLARIVEYHRMFIRAWRDLSLRLLAGLETSGNQKGLIWRYWMQPPRISKTGPPLRASEAASLSKLREELQGARCGSERREGLPGPSLTFTVLGRSMAKFEA